MLNTQPQLVFEFLCRPWHCTEGCITDRYTLMSAVIMPQDPYPNTYAAPQLMAPGMDAQGAPTARRVPEGVTSIEWPKPVFPNVGDTTSEKKVHSSHCILNLGCS